MDWFINEIIPCFYFLLWLTNSRDLHSLWEHHPWIAIVGAVSALLAFISFVTEKVNDFRKAQVPQKATVPAVKGGQAKSNPPSSPTVRLSRDSGSNVTQARRPPPLPPEMINTTQTYSISLQGKVMGPFTLEQLITRSVQPDLPIFKTGTIDWTIASRLPELSVYFGWKKTSAPFTASTNAADSQADHITANPRSPDSAMSQATHGVSAGVLPPRMLRWLVCYAIIWSPLFWFIGGIIWLVEGNIPAALIVKLITLPATAILFLGGLRVRSRRPSGLTLLKLGLLIETPWALFLLYVFSISGWDSFTIGVVIDLLTIGIYFFEFVALLWLLFRPIDVGTLEWTHPAISHYI